MSGPARPVVMAIAAAGLAAAALWLAGLASDDAVRREATRARLAEVTEVLAGVTYTNVPTQDTIVVRDAERLGGDAPRRVFRAFDNAAPAAVALQTVAPGGYSGPVHLLVGIRADGTLSGVRITAHRETRGLGDRIERARSDWVLSFDGRHLGSPPEARWGVRRDGGDFDQFTGATVTPRAVVEAVRNALVYFEASRDTLFAEDATRAHPE